MAFLWFERSLRAAVPEPDVAARLVEEAQTAAQRLIDRKLVMYAATGPYEEALGAAQRSLA